MADFELSRSTHVDADPETVRALLDDFREWVHWSPWEGVDPDLRRTYSGPERGVGATYEWAGNKQAGEGRMRITSSDPAAVVLDLDFLKPFKASNVTRFDLVPSGGAGTGGGTDVSWTMTGRRGAVMSLMGRLFFDKAIGKDFDKGLAALKATAEAR
ncbi:SRPBCC family protein [Janibacter sp. CX7]|uniref:SRPBCC family protein n=1 Tax=Janibacter sp. CX7 TaxID=2963431 RepID=UPI0020CF9B57|nr:SRPBCC family protein [Janibacter sp. CX7]UTT65817.1 SRPBCC family protein [Janibacter sp. CX7]